MRPLLLLVILAYSTLAFSQREQVWAFNGSGLDFNTSSGEPVGILTSMDTKEAAASICDENGELLFYTEGSIVWNKDHQIMSNGTALTPFANTFMTPTVSTTQGTVIIPMIDSAHKYYIFSLVASEWGQNMGNLYYSVVDMRLDNGLGNIDPNEKAVFVASGLVEKMIPIVGNNCNIWLLTCSQDERFHAFEITASGINPNAVVSDVGVGNNRDVYGALAASPDRRRVAAASTSRASIFDFDASTGRVTNELVVHRRAAYGVCFSPDNSKLYISGFGIQSAQTIQFDLSINHPDSIRESATNLGGLQFVNLKAGPDDKIYFGSSSSRLGVIRFPNLRGQACEFTPNAILLPGNPGISSNPALPNAVPVLQKEIITTSQTFAPRFTDTLAVNAQVQSGSDYLWNDGLTGPDRIIRTSGTYWVNYHLPPCRKQTDTFHVHFPCALPEIETRPSCGTASVGAAWVIVPSHHAATYSYTWSDPGGTLLSDSDSLLEVPAGVYSLRITTNTGCDTMVYVEIDADDFQVSFHTDSLICEGEEQIFENTSDGYYEQFYWSFGDQHTASSHSPVHTYPESGVYTAMLIGEGRYCTDTAVQNIRVDGVVEALQLIPSVKSLCVGETVVLHTELDPTFTNLVWDFGDQSIVRSLQENAQHAYDEAGKKVISLSASFRACPELIAKDSLHVYPLPAVYLGKDTTICPKGAPILLSNRFESEERVHYLWNTGARSTTLQATQAGLYSLRVTSEEGCSSTEDIRISKDCYIDIPNVFSPNGDGVNDYFFPRQLLSRGLSYFHMEVYSRWGQRVFETTNLQGRGWDGSLNNIPQPPGVYMYKIVVETQAGQHTEYLGNVTLLR